MKTAKVKIMIAINKDGKWNASGWGGPNGPTEEEQSLAKDIAREDMEVDYEVYTIIADIPIPNDDEKTIEGNFERSEK